MKAQLEHGVAMTGGTGRERAKVPWWRRKYVVNREFQTRFALNAVIIGLVSSLVSVGMVLWAFYAFNIWQGQRLPRPVLAVIVAVVGVNLMTIYLSVVVATQRIVGPLFNLLRQFQRLSHADFDAYAKFREYDEIHYVGRKFNEMVMKLSARDEFIFSKIDEALTHLQNGDPERSRAPLSFLREMRAKEREDNRTIT